MMKKRKEDIMKETWAEHGFPPFMAPDARLLILGSFPSIRSREEGFYYAHPQNRFWRVLAGVHGEAVPVTLDEKKSFLTRHHIALHDVIESCRITGSSDASIREAVPADITALLSASAIRTVVCNGAKSARLFMRFQGTGVLQGFSFHALPSTSAANASWSLERLIEAWSSIKGETTC